MKGRILLVFIISIYGSGLIGQVETEDILWSSLAFSKKFSDKWSAQIKPTVRHNNEISNYQNASVDLSVKNSFAKGWGAQFLTRLWFIPDGNDRLFLWADVNYKTTIPSLSVSVNQRLRYHLALDTGPTTDLDYFRYIVDLVPATSWKFKPTLSYERWFILNDVERFRLSRLQPGFIYTITDRISFKGQLWRQLERQVDGSTFFQNLWQASLGYKL